MTATNLANNPVLHDHTKNVQIDHHFIREKIDSNELVLPYIKSLYKVRRLFGGHVYKRVFLWDFELIYMPNLGER